MSEDDMRSHLQKKLRSKCKKSSSVQALDLGACVVAKVVHNKCTFRDKKCSTDAKVQCLKDSMKDRNKGGDDLDECCRNVMAEELLRRKKELSAMSEEDLRSHFQKKLRTTCKNGDGRRIDLYACNSAKIMHNGCLKLDEKPKAECIIRARSDCTQSKPVSKGQTKRRGPVQQKRKPAK